MGIYPWNKFRYLACEISFFPPELLLHNYNCGGCVPFCVTVNTHTIVNWKKFCEMLLTTLAHNQHDVIWRLPVWNVKIRRYFRDRNSLFFPSSQLDYWLLFSRGPVLFFSRWKRKIKTFGHKWIIIHFKNPFNQVIQAF